MANDAFCDFINERWCSKKCHSEFDCIRYYAFSERSSKGIISDSIQSEATWNCRVTFITVRSIKIADESDCFQNCPWEINRTFNLELEIGLNWICWNFDTSGMNNLKCVPRGQYHIHILHQRTFNTSEARQHHTRNLVRSSSIDGDRTMTPIWFVVWKSKLMRH